MLPSPTESMKFLTSNHSVWLATFVVASMYFSSLAQVLPLKPVHGVVTGGSQALASAGKPMEYAPPADLGLTMAMGSMGILLSDPLPRVTGGLASVESKADLGLTLAIGKLGLIFTDRVPRIKSLITASPLQTAPSPTPSADAGLTLAIGRLGLLLSEPAAKVTQRRGVRSAPNATLSDLGLSLAIGRLGILISDPIAPRETGEATEPPEWDESSFIMTCALVHTIIVGAGMAFGSDTLVDHNWREPLLRAGGASILFFCVALYLSWEYQLGPWPRYLEAATHATEAAYIVLGALEMTAWLAIAMLAPHSQLGRACTRSRALHAAVGAIGIGVHLVGVSAPIAYRLLCVFSVVAAAALGNSGVVVAKGADCLTYFDAPRRWTALAWSF